MMFPYRKPGPKARLSREVILRAALATSREITITGIAEQLGCSAAALYRHVESKDDIVIGALELLIAETPRPDPARGWRGLLEQECDVRWRLYEGHPELFAAWPRTGRPVIASVRRNEWVALRVADAGFDLADARGVVAAIAAAAADYGLLLAFQQRPGAVQALDARLGVLGPEMRAVEQDRLSRPRHHFDRQLRILLDGFAVHYERAIDEC
ncbi:MULTISPECIES: TetR/AcrR family transcriptional regulator [unclassified Rhodococcus (in: high G+C Gram-positive bacteria)]|uniref:TetR/AcrR family transcriptional regulator n=1 Tax=Rhodococcus sp. SJ-3 TaxID=3454628 RepID=UPI002D8EA10D|nr:hypothetical protein [Rhodococcus sp. (in: high G+C Gram-positive bacteria)]